MIPEPIYNILFIDDDSELYMPVLEPAASEQGFTLYDVSNVKDGLKLLNDYPDTLDAVLLDITFNTGEMQGLEALRKIKSLFPYLPVIMLTGSDKASDLHKVVKCMRNGAYDYIGKQNLDPTHLFQTVYEAIGKSKQQYRLENKISRHNLHEPLYVIQSYTSENNNEHAVFGFRLVSVNKPKNREEEEQMQHAAFEWHRNLLQSIHFAYKGNLAISLKFIAKQGRLDIYLLFILSEKDKSLLKTALGNLFQDIQFFFATNQSDNLKPYVFEEISDKNFLLNANKTPENYYYTLYHRKPLSYTEPNSIGFKKPGKHSSNLKDVVNTGIVLPLPENLNFNYDLLKSLLYQQEVTEIDVRLKPRKLSIDEIQSVRRIIQNPSVLGNNHNQESFKASVTGLEQFLITSNDKFAVSILLKTTQPRFDHHLNTGILYYFFNDASEVGNDARPGKNLCRYSMSQSEDKNQLAFVYDQSNVIQAFHLPMPDCNYIPGIIQQSHIFHKLPSVLPVEGITLGEKVTGEEALKIRIGKEDLSRHLYIMGQTGTGKSSMLKTMIADCLKSNQPFAMIDPHGDLFDEVYKIIPAAKRKKTVILDITNPQNSAKHNPIGYDEKYPQSKSLVINELIRIFNSLYDMRNAGGPMFELYLKNGFLLLLDEKVRQEIGEATLNNFVDIFFVNKYRKELLNICGNQKVVDFFKVAEENSGDWSFSNFATYITSKLTRFTEDYYITPVITSKENNINFRKLIDEGYNLLVKLEKGLSGADNVSLLGQMIVSSVVMAAMSRTNIDKTQRKPYYLFVDEFQNFIKGDVGSALSEVRKYGLSMILANQTLGQLQDANNDVLQGLMGNVGSMIFFRPGINDYDKIKHFFEPDFDKSEVLKLPNFNCIGRIMTNNVPGDPFVFSTIVNS